MSIVIRRAVNNQFYFTVRSSNGQVLATSETYWNKSDALAAGKLIQSQAWSADILDLA